MQPLLSMLGLWLQLGVCTSDRIFEQVVSERPVGDIWVGWKVQTEPRVDQLGNDVNMTPINLVPEFSPSV